ncbi:uncharacterized protein LOC143541041 [Bidens hawaiensis]|uniref:uncharacterized protein LOC143541041 n=1 Tax=Bidens hawaiensis TaxID=980011 RepID=UPI00404903A8
MEATPKQGRSLKKSLFSESKSSDKDISTNDGHEDKMNPKSETRWTRAKIQKSKGISVDDDNESSKKPSPVTSRRSTRSLQNHEAANIKTEVAKESCVDELPTQENNKDSGGNVTSNGGRSYGSKKKSLNLDKQKVRSSPRFTSKS